MMRSSRNRPLSLSISYLARDPCGISITALTVRGAWSPGGTPCQGWETVIMNYFLFGDQRTQPGCSKTQKHTSCKIQKECSISVLLQQGQGFYRICRER